MPRSQRDVYLLQLAPIMAAENMPWNDVMPFPVLAFGCQIYLRPPDRLFIELARIYRVNLGGIGHAAYS
ncbi:hypothetical protein H5A40_17160 [Pectobacterium brasiliense]|uniref:hypothetical protein n=1 Tax=Pectobacterium brasiliense TaxID=180957 RepID=UPI000CE68BDF|nr:hypothetical protein [Pectobacterium brasiliense]QSD34781.1 hypothetical protein H5A40_17160 [Pectobacterium brasiliense]